MSRGETIERGYRGMSWRDWPTYSAQCRQDVARLLRNGTRLTAYRASQRHGPGPAEGSWAWRAERLAEKIHKVPHVVLCANGTLALTVLLKVLGTPLERVITSAFTFSATVASIIHAGLVPVFADVCIPDMVLDLGSVFRMRTSRLETILDVYLFGKRPLVSVIADACQAVGIVPSATHGVWSFNGRKNVPAGEGGAIFTHNSGVADRARLLLGHAENFRAPYVSGTPRVGENGHVNEVTACLIYHGLAAVQTRNQHRQRMAKRLNIILATDPRLTLPNLENHALYMYPLILEGQMPTVAARLARKGIECQPGYIQPPLFQYPAFQRYRRDDLVNTVSLSRSRLLLFPQITPTVTGAEVDQLGEAILEAMP